MNIRGYFWNFIFLQLIEDSTDAEVVFCSFPGKKKNG